MKIGTVLVWIGILAYVASFFLIAVRDSVNHTNGLYGHECALTALTWPWQSDGLKQLRQSPVDYFSVLFSGWINPLFLVTLLVRWRNPRGRAGWVLVVILLLMFPACWVVFARAHLVPSSGYFLWTAAMLLAVFARASTGAPREQKIAQHV